MPDSPDDPALTEPWGDMMERAMGNPIAPMDKWKPSAHTAAALSIRHALQKLPGWKRIRKRNTARYVLADRAGNPIKKHGKWVHVTVGVKGDTDIEMLWRWPGLKRALPFLIEVKTGSGRLSPEQQENERDCRDGNVIFIVAGTAAAAFEACLEAKAYVERHG